MLSPELSTRKQSADEDGTFQQMRMTQPGRKPDPPLRNVCGGKPPTLLLPGFPEKREKKVPSLSVILKPF